MGKDTILGDIKYKEGTLIFLKGKVVKMVILGGDTSFLGKYVFGKDTTIYFYENATIRLVVVGEDTMLRGRLFKKGTIIKIDRDGKLMK